MITYDIHVPIGLEQTDRVASVKCHDTGVNFRVLPETVSEDAKRRKIILPYQIPEGSTAILKAVKPDNTPVLVDGDVDGTSILFKKEPQMFTVAGIIKAEVSIYSPDGERLTTATFLIEVPQECVCDGMEYDGSGENKVYPTTDGVSFVDMATKNKHTVYVDNGKLMMAESEE